MTSPSGRWRDLIAGDFLESSAAGFAAPFLAEGREPGPEPEWSGAVIGRYRLLREIGRGGMGAVWLAERADGHYEQQVALKLIKRGMDSDEILARFLRERQILARLEHPNIARLLDGGVSDEGRPYFVMELVEGHPITRACDTRRLGIEDRLRLFVTVCRAVQHAHRNLVVHRDLKPTNVLLTESGEVKLLDFGVAKLLGEEPTGEATAPGRLLTPEYASPEQLHGGSVTTASDVYQLGLLLYELLTGRRPFGTGRAVSRDQEPPHPSTEVGRVAKLVHRDGSSETIEPALVSEHRASTPAGLRRRLRGDLDAIALRALRAEPDQRHPSAEALAEDLELHLADRPIRFGSGGWAYRAGKFVRRYRLRLLAAAALVVLALLGSSIYVFQVRAERDRALGEAAKASETATLLRRFLQGWSPDAADRGKVSAENLLGDAARRAERELSRNPEMLAATLSTIGDLYFGLGKFGTADSILTRALALQERVPRGAELDLAATLARRGRVLQSMTRYRESELTFHRALELYRGRLGPERPEVLRTQLELANSLYPQEKLVEAETLLRELQRRLPDPEAPFATEVASALGYVLFREARNAEAAELLRASLARQRAVFGNLHLSTMQTMRMLASSLRDRRDLPEAEALDREALQIAYTLFGPNHTETSVGRYVLALLLERKGDFPEAERLAREAIATDTVLNGSLNVQHALMLRTLAGLRLAQGDLAGANLLLRRSLLLLQRLDPANADLGDVLNRLAYVVFQRGDADSAAIYRQAADFERARPPLGPWFFTDGYEYLAWTASRTGDQALAERLFRRAVELYGRELPVEHPYRKQAELGLRHAWPGDPAGPARQP